MARNVTESDFRTSKMAAGSHFIKKITKIKIVVLIWNGKKCDTKLFLDIQNGYRRPFFLNIYKKLREWTMVFINHIIFSKPFSQQLAERQICSTQYIFQFRFWQPKNLNIIIGKLLEGC